MTVATRDQHGERSLRAQLLEPKSIGPKSQVPPKTRNQRRYPTPGTYNVKGGQKRESEFRIALATSKRMLERSYRLEVSSNETNSSDDSHCREDDPNPPVPNVRCNHDYILAIRGDANIAVTIKVFLQARFEAHKKTIRQLVVVDLATDCCLQFKMEFEGLLTINASVEMAMNMRLGVIRQLAVDIRLKFVQRLFAVSH